jgi:2-keto-3-deoxy-L-rhamnonate aldolase RhmA
MADLSHAMGLTGDYHHPDMYAAIERVLRAARHHGVSVGIPTADPKRAAYWAAKGIRYFEADAPDYLLRQMYADQLAALRAAFADTSGEPVDH